MKKLILIATVALFSYGAKAQDFAGQIGTTVTHTNVQADTIPVTISKSRPTVTFKYDIAKTSGTIAGTIVLQGRLTTGDAWVQVNSYTLTDATASNVVSLTNNAYLYYRVITTTSGTSVSVHKKYLLYRGY